VNILDAEDWTDLLPPGTTINQSAMGDVERILGMVLVGVHSARQQVHEGLDTLGEDAKSWREKYVIEQSRANSFNAELTHANHRMKQAELAAADKDEMISFLKKHIRLLEETK
jgi:hypothetical protein